MHVLWRTLDVRDAVAEGAWRAQPAHSESQPVFEGCQVLPMRVVRAGAGRVTEDVQRPLAEGRALLGLTGVRSDQNERLEPKQAVPPPGRVCDLHPRSHPQDRNVQPALQEGVELGDAVHRVLSQGDLRLCAREGGSDKLAGGQLEDMGDPDFFWRGAARHGVGERQQAPGVSEELLTSCGQADVAAVAHEQGLAELVLKLADLLRERRLADVEPRGGTPEVQIIRHSDEVANEP